MRILGNKFLTFSLVLPNLARMMENILYYILGAKLGVRLIRGVLR